MSSHTWQVSNLQPDRESKLRLWNCTQPIAMESHNRDIMDLLETLTKAPRGSEGGVLLSARVWRGCHWGGGTLVIKIHV